MSDFEEGWEPSRRPQSTLAQAFSLELDSAFMLDNDVDHLAQTIEQKKQMVTIQARELEALQARIRETEERLRNQAGQASSPTGNQRTSSREEDSEPVDIEDDETQDRSSPSSSVSGHRPSDEDFTDSSTSAATSNHPDEVGSDGEHKKKLLPRGSRTTSGA